MFRNFHETCLSWPMWFVEIVELVSKEASPPFRPVITEGEWPAVQELMGECLHEQPAARPDTGRIQAKCKKINR